MLIRTSIYGPLFYEFIFNMSLVPRLVCPSGFMLSPLGSEVMISCHVAFFRVICYNPALQIKMTTTAPPGHVHDEVVLQWKRSEEGEARWWFWNGDDGEERRWFCNGEDQKRERRDGGFGMEMMERRRVVLQWRRGRGACDSNLGLGERAGAL